MQRRSSTASLTKSNDRTGLLALLSTFLTSVSAWRHRRAVGELTCHAQIECVVTRSTETQMRLQIINNVALYLGFASERFATRRSETKVTSRLNDHAVSTHLSASTIAIRVNDSSCFGGMITRLKVHNELRRAPRKRCACDDQTKEGRLFGSGDDSWRVIWHYCFSAHMSFGCRQDEDATASRLECCHAQVGVSQCER
jgi:hypothetical protein